MSRRGRTARVASRQRVETLGNGTSAPTNKTIDKVETGELYFIDHNHASALTITLPPMQDGAYFKFIFKTALTVDGSVVIATSEATAGSIVGSIFEQVTGGSNAASGVDTDDGTDVKITLSDDIHPGSWVECFCDGSVWHAHARLNVSGVGESGFGDYVAPGPTHDPGPAMSRLYAGFDESGVCFGAAASLGGDVDTVRDLFEDTMFDAISPSNIHILKMVYGKDGSGNPLIVLLTKADTKSLYRVTPDQITAKTEGSATNITFNGPSNLKQRDLAYGNGVWISVGHLGNSAKNIYRSTDGTTWDPIDLASLLSSASGGTIFEGGVGHFKIWTVTTDGAGKWWFGIDDKTTVEGGSTGNGSTSYIFGSTDDGQTWSLHHTLTTSDIYRLTYTNNTLVATYNYAPGDGTGGRQAVSAAASDTTDWGTPVFLCPNGTRDSSNMIAKTHGPTIAEWGSLVRIASAGGRVICADTDNLISMDVSGKTITIAANAFIENFAKTDGTGFTAQDITGIATDGEGNWYVGGSIPGKSLHGSIAKNTNNADPSSWAVLTNDISPSGAGHDGVGNTKLLSLMADRYLPL